MSAAKKPPKRSQPSVWREILTITKNSLSGFVAGVVALALRPVLQQILRWHEWRELKAARLLREQRRKPLLAKKKLPFLEMPFKLGSHIGDVPAETIT